MTEMQAAAWISENLTAIYGYAFARLYDKNKVDELVSEIICAVLSSVRRLRKDAAFYGFVWRTAENTFRKFIRRDDPACCGDAELETLTDICGASAEDVYIEREEKEKMLYLLRREACRCFPKRTVRFASPTMQTGKAAPALQKNRASAWRW